MAEALYRKFRPQVFDDVVGQDHIERTLKNAIERDQVSHAYLFTGPRGTGKTTTARLLAKALLCEHAPTSNPCGECEDCKLIAAGEHPDVNELDAASRTGVDNVREEIIGRVQYAPTRGKRKVYIIDEVHMLSAAAFNALLKTLEEPPEHVVFILCTTDPQKVLETVQSRCQRFDFHRISHDDIVLRLSDVCAAEGVPFETDALQLIAQRAEGGMRDALTALEQIIVFGGGSVTMDAAEQVFGSLKVSDMGALVAAIGRRDGAACFRWVARFVEDGADLARFTQDLTAHVRDLYVVALVGNAAVLGVDDAAQADIHRELEFFGPDRLSYMLGVLGDLQNELKTSSNARLAFEIACTRMARPSCDLSLESLAARLDALERAITNAGSSQRLADVGAFEPESRFEESPVPAPVAREDAQGTAGGDNALPDEAEAARNGNESGFRDAPTQEAGVHASSGAQRVDLTNNAALQRAWQQALGLVKREKIAYGVLFINTQVTFVGERLRIVFSAENDFAYKAVQKPEVGQMLENALREVFGGDIPFVFERAASVASSAGVSAEDASPAPAISAAPPTPVFPAETDGQSVRQPTSVAVESISRAVPEPDYSDIPAYEPTPLSAYEDDQVPAVSGKPEAVPAEQSAENGLDGLQDALSLFGNIRIEEI